MTELSPSDYQLGPAFTKELSLFGKDNKAEKLRVMQRPSLFNKNFKVIWANYQRPIIVSIINPSHSKISRYGPYWDILGSIAMTFWLKCIKTQVSKCVKSGCKEEPLAADEEERVVFYFIFKHNVFCSGNTYWVSGTGYQVLGIKYEILSISSSITWYLVWVMGIFLCNLQPPGIF